MKKYESLESLVRLDRKLKKEAERAPDYPPERLVSEYLGVTDKVRLLQTHIQELQDRRQRFRAKVFVKGRSGRTLTDEKMLYIEEHCNKRFQQILRNRGAGSLSDSEAEKHWANFVHKVFDYWNTTPASGQALRNIQKLSKRIILNDTALHGWREHMRLLEVIAEEKAVPLPHAGADKPASSHVQSQVQTRKQGTKPSGAANVFRKDGDRFTVKYAGGKTFYLDTLDGCHYIVHLLGQPDHEFDCINLVHALNKGSVAPHPEQKSDYSDLNASPWEAVDQTYDERARKAVSREIKELEAEAGNCTDPHETLLKREKREELQKYLRSGSSPSGKPRRTESALEKARTNVRKRIKTVLDKIAKEDSALHKHLVSSIKTGASCSYRPEKSILWVL